MSWLNKFLPPRVDLKADESNNASADLWYKCDGCREVLYFSDLKENINVCPKCDYHHQLTSRERIAMLLDEGSKQIEIAENVVAKDILGFVDSKKYTTRIIDTQAKINEKDAIVVVAGQLDGKPVVVAAFEFRFIGGSMGSVVGEKFVRGVKYAAENNCAFICVAASGGARMQEGATSLMQMAKTSASLHLLSDKKLPFISVLTNPTMGGVSASFAFLGDVVIAEPKALIGFAGPRVIEQTIREKLPDGFQSAEFLLNKGALDMVTHRKNLKAEIGKIISFLQHN